MAGVDRSDMYKLRKTDPYFAEDWAKALELGVSALEDEVHRRAFEGELITNQYGTYRKYNDTLAIFLMKTHKPDKYCDRYRTMLSITKKSALNYDDPKVLDKFHRTLNAVMNKQENGPIVD